MIELDTTTQAYRDKFDHLKEPPTHAYLNYRGCSYLPGHVIDLHLNYVFGLIVDGVFSVLPMCGTQDFHLPDPNRVPMDTSDKLLNTLYGAGLAPHPSDATKTIAVPHKKEGDHKITDIDLIMSSVIPTLKGTVV
jgi:hypothetical protein